MARTKPPYRIYCRDGIAWIDTRSIPGVKRCREPLDVPYGNWPRRRPTRAAQEAASARYRELLAKHAATAPATSPSILTTYTDEEMFALWLDSIPLTPRTRDSIAVKGVYARTWHGFFADPDRWAKDPRTPIERMIDSIAVEDYALHRLTKALRGSVRKELTAMFAGFFAWAKGRHIAVVPARPALPKGNPGVRTGPQRAKPVHIEPSEARAIIDLLPEWSDALRSTRKGYPERAFLVRPVFDFMWEQTFRPSTIARLSVPRNWSRGRKTITIHDEDDKALYGREVALSARAVAILERYAPDEGLIFGKHDYRTYLKAAALKVLPREKAIDFARYDFRHGRINNLLEVSGNMPGVGQVAGHLQMTTTNRYVRAQQRQGEAVMRAADAAEMASLGGTGKAPEPMTDDRTADSSSGRPDSNRRPLVPQRSDSTQGREGTSDDRARDVGDSRRSPADHGAMGTPSGHQAKALTDAVRALPVEMAIWDAFDAFAYLASEEEGA